MVSEAELAVALSILGLVIGTCIGAGVLDMPKPKLMFDLMMLSTFVWMLIWTIRKRSVRARKPLSGDARAEEE
jgi:hypothetical protein